MSLLLETTLGDITIDLDVDGSPSLCRNLIKLAKARYYTNTLCYNVQPGRFCQFGDPKGDGTGGCSIYGLIDSTTNNTDITTKKDPTKSKQRFIKSDGRILRKSELRRKGMVIATEMGGVCDTIGSQFLITVDEGEEKALDGFSTASTKGDDSLLWTDDRNDGGSSGRFFSLGAVVEDPDGVLDKINGMYLDKEGRPYADLRIVRAHIVDDPYDDPVGMDEVLTARNVTLLDPKDLPEKDVDCTRWLASSSPMYERPPEEDVEIRISALEALGEEDEATEKKKREEMDRKEDKSRAVVLEMLGDLPSADLKPPENVLFVCKLNSITEDEDLQLIFSRFDPNAKAEIIRDPVTGDSLQYAFVEFNTKEQCSEAYFKMNNALVDDRRIKVDFSQSVAKVWNKFNRGEHKQKRQQHQHASSRRPEHATRRTQNNNHYHGGAGTTNHPSQRYNNTGQHENQRFAVGDDRVRNSMPHYDTYRREHGNGNGHRRRNDKSIDGVGENKMDHDEYGHEIRNGNRDRGRSRNTDEYNETSKSKIESDSDDGSSDSNSSRRDSSQSRSSDRDHRKQSRSRRHRKKGHYKDDRGRRHKRRQKEDRHERKKHRNRKNDRKHKKSRKHKRSRRSRSRSRS